MELKSLTVPEIRRIYRRYLRKDFPASERKSLGIILRSVRSDTYDCLGLFEGERVVAYAFFLRHGADLLFDYLAVIPEMRGNGTGGRFLGMLLEHYRDADSIIGEIEDPEFAATEEEAAVMKRREFFYCRNGFRNTGIKTYTFGVHYMLIEPECMAHTEDAVRELYRAHYKAVLPARMYVENIIL